MIRVDGTVERGDLRLRVDLTIGPGITAIVGPNGAGKTSLLRVLAGLDPLTQGRLVIDGPPGEELVLDDEGAGVFVPAHERLIAMAFQDHRLLPHLRVVDNVAYPLRRQGLPRDEARAAVGAVLDSVGLGDLAAAHPAELSGGQRQRVAVARALATPARVLLLDEPLASVDDETRSLLRARLTVTDHEAVVWVTHDPADAELAASTVSIDRAGIRQTAAS